MPSLRLHLRRNVEESRPGRILPLAFQSLENARSDLQEVYVAVNKNQLSNARTLLVDSLRAMMLIAVSTDAEATEASSQVELLIPSD